MRSPTGRAMFMFDIPTVSREAFWPVTGRKSASHCPDQPTPMYLPLFVAVSWITHSGRSLFDDRPVSAESVMDCVRPDCDVTNPVGPSSPPVLRVSSFWLALEIVTSRAATSATAFVGCVPLFSKIQRYSTAFWPPICSTCHVAASPPPGSRHVVSSICRPSGDTDEVVVLRPRWQQHLGGLSSVEKRSGLRGGQVCVKEADLDKNEAEQ